MKALVLALLVLLVVHAVIHREHRPQRTPAEQKAWASWFDAHRDGGGL